MRKNYSLMSGQRGFTIVEVMVAAVILTAALLPLFAVVSRGAMLSLHAQERTVAMALAIQKMEEIKSYLPAKPADFAPGTELNSRLFSQDAPEVITDMQVEKGIKRTFARYATYQAVNSATKGPYAYYEIVVTVILTWNEYQAGKAYPQEIKLSEELVGR